jgi:hypothetical protein
MRSIKTLEMNHQPLPHTLDLAYLLRDNNLLTTSGTKGTIHK